MSNHERTRRYKRAKGTVSPEGTCRSVAIRFDTDVFEVIATEADKHSRSFAEQVRIYVGRGMSANGAS